MAAFVPVKLGSVDFVTLGAAFGPEARQLVATGTYTATAQQEFAIIGKPQVVAITIHTAAAGGTESTTPTVEYFDVATQAWVVLLTGAAIVVNGSSDVILKVGPHATDVTNLSANTALYERMRINMTHGNANAHPYSISVAAI